MGYFGLLFTDYFGNFRKIHIQERKEFKGKIIWGNTVSITEPRVKDSLNVVPLFTPVWLNEISIRIIFFKKESFFKPLKSFRGIENQSLKHPKWMQVSETRLHYWESSFWSFQMRQFYGAFRKLASSAAEAASVTLQTLHNGSFINFIF